MVDIPITRTLGVNPVSAWVQSNLDALVKMYIPGIQEIEIRGKTLGSEYTCMLTFLYDKKEEVWLFPDAKYNDDKIRDYAYADGINVSSISPHKVFNGEKIEVRIVFYADKIDFDKRKPANLKKSYKYSWEMAKGGMTNDEIYAPEGYVFVKIGSHRARKKVVLENIKYISLFTFSRVRSAGESTFFMSETDFKKIKNIVGVTRLKKINGIWFSRFEDRILDKIFEKIRIEPYSKGGMTKGSIKYSVTYFFDDETSTNQIYRSKKEMEDSIPDFYIKNNVTDIEIKEITEPVFKGEEKKIFEFGKSIKNISQLKELTKFKKIDSPDNFTSVIQFFEINGYNEKLIDLLYKWEESQKTDASGWFEISKIFYEKYRADRTRYNDGGGIPYKNLSLEKPQVIMDSNIEDTGENGLAEIEIVKTRTISIPAINTSGQITSSSDAAKLFRAIWHTDQMNVAEHFNVIFLNRSNKPIGFYQHSIGGITGTIVDVELICASAIKSLSKGVLVAHNHPSGNLKPSQSDLKITKELKDALALFQISLVDSMILVPYDDYEFSPQYYSMLDEGLLF